MNITLLVKIKYGNALVTHLTCLPYYLTLALLILMLVNHASYLTLSTYFESHPDKKEEPAQILFYCLTTASIIKYALMVTLILLRAFENELLLVFIFFQKNLRLESLDVARDTYRNLEKKMTRGLIGCYAVVMMPMLIQIVGQFTSKYIQISIYLTVYYACLLTMAIAGYTSSSISLIANMRRSHRMAFNSHIKSLVALFVATLMSVFFYLGLQFYIIRYVACEFVRGQAMNGIDKK